MICIEFDNIDYETVTPPTDAFYCYSWLEDTFCYANQLITADRFKFAEECPTLAFARALRNIGYGLKYQKRSGKYVNKLGQNRCFLTFRIDGNTVLIESIRGTDEKVEASVWVPLDEFVEATRLNFENVIATVATMIPELLADPFVNDWLKAPSEEY